jgi:hypothetical protein
MQKDNRPGFPGLESAEEFRESGGLLGAAEKGNAEAEGEEVAPADEPPGQLDGDEESPQRISRGEQVENAPPLSSGRARAAERARLREEAREVRKEQARLNQEALAERNRESGLDNVQFNNLDDDSVFQALLDAEPNALITEGAKLTGNSLQRAYVPTPTAPPVGSPKAGGDGNSAGPALPYSLSPSGSDIIVTYGYVKARNEDSGYDRTATGMDVTDGFTVSSPSNDDWISLKVEVEYPNVAIELTIDVTNGSSPPTDVAPVSGGSNGYYYLPLGQVSISGSDLTTTSLASSNFLFDIACDGMAVWGRL